MKKSCTQCKITKPLDDFHRHKRGKYGRTEKCRKCCSIAKKIHDSKPEVKAARNAKQAQKLRDHPEIRLKLNEYQNTRNKRPEVKTVNSNYHKEHNKIPEVADRIRECRRVNRRRPEVKDKNNASRRKRYQEDPYYHLSCILRAAQTRVLKQGKAKKRENSIIMTSCTVEHLWQHLESTFSKTPCPKTGKMMTRANHGKIWHIDHIRPCASFDLTDPEQQKLCFHWSNLQALFVNLNLRKSSKWNGVFVRNKNMYPLL